MLRFLEQLKPLHENLGPSMFQFEYLNKQFAWQAGYGAFSVSKSNVDQVIEYIRNQEEHHRKMSFQDEVRAFFRKHRVEFDERHVWD